jgi:hypothetical protein
MRQRLRLLAFVVASPAIVGAWILAGDTDDIDPAMAWLLIPALAAGLVLSARFYPLRITDADTERMNREWKRSFADIGILSLANLVILMVSAVAHQFVDSDGSAFAVAALVSLLAGGAALLGVLGSFLTVLPAITLAGSLRRMVARRPVDAEPAAGATLLLSVAIFATSLVLATSVETSGSSRSEAWVAIFVLLTGIQSDDARITSEPLAWVARVFLGLIVASIVWLSLLSRKRKRLARG